MTRNFIPGAEPLFIEGDDTGCLLLHGGGGGTTWDLKEFAEVLHSQTGMTVWLPALTGYGTKPEDLYDVTLDEWMNDANTGIDRLLETCNKIRVVGHSMGGLLSLLIASERKEISGVVTWAAPFSFKNRLASLLPAISRVPGIRRVIPEKHRTEIPDWLRDQGWIGYDWIPTGIGIVALEGLRRLKHALAGVACPILILQGTEDEAVTSESPERIYTGVASERKEIKWIEGATHPMMNDNRYKDDLFTHTVAFLSGI